MAVSLKTGFSVSGSVINNGVNTKNSKKKIHGVRICSKSLSIPVLKTEFMGRKIVVSEQSKHGDWNVEASVNTPVHAQALCVSKALRWWDKTLKPNMVEIKSAQELVDTLVKNAGDQLVIIDFYSPGCGGCKALHPKICQFAELNPNALFLKVNYEELKPMCYSLNIHVLPFFRFYRGADGRVCSFSCTNATIKKFRDAMAKYGTERCSLGPAKGLDESELMKLVENGQLSRDYLPKTMPTTEGNPMEDLVIAATSAIIQPDIRVVEENAAVLV